MEAVASHNHLAGALVDPFPVHDDFVEHFFAQTGAAALGEFAQGSLTHRSAQERVGARVGSDVVGGDCLNFLYERFGQFTVDWSVEGLIAEHRHGDGAVFLGKSATHRVAI